ncbi:hypothetical protein PVAND_003255 [Polypedilum vanderplanki]|uniref:Uncharacterized protein n=1 Tax=Polypedilum vanderplanki TaxID=319348 RepID=A0A9J6BTI6_POLVA|nr:hypothetical protein PVAND_003255 [Polypedilum vanderplanki]
MDQSLSTTTTSQKFNFSPQSSNSIFISHGGAQNSQQFHNIFGPVSFNRPLIFKNIYKPSKLSVPSSLDVKISDEGKFLLIKSKKQEIVSESHEMECEKAYRALFSQELMLSMMQDELK